MERTERCDWRILLWEEINSDLSIVEDELIRGQLDPQSPKYLYNKLYSTDL